MKTTRHIFTLLLYLALVLIPSLFIQVARAQTRDSLVTYDSLYHVCKDSLGKATKIVQVPIPVTSSDVHGIYMHPNDCAIGNELSENSFLSYCKRIGANELNCYARTFLTTSSKQAQLAAFIKKAKGSYGITYVSVDVRGVSEIQYWSSYQSKYSGTISKIDAALTEWDLHIDHRYSEFFQFLPQMTAVCKQFGFALNFYGGWPGQGWVGGSEAACWDSIVKYTFRIYISNYLPQSQYIVSGGAWDGRMDKRTAWIATAAKRQSKVESLVEIISLELIKWGAGSDFLGNVFSCPMNTTNLCYPLYDLTKAKADYKRGPYSIPLIDVTTKTKYIGRTFFYSKYVKLAQP